jgi:phosphate acetyltransferase
MQQHSYYIASLKALARHKKCRIAFPDALDERTLEAAQTLVRETIATPVLVGNTAAIEAAAHGKYSLDGVNIFDPRAAANAEQIESFAQALYERRKHKGMTLDEARATLLNDQTGTLFVAGMALSADMVQGSVGGSLSTTGDVLRAGILTLGTAAGIKTVSSFFLMLLAGRVLCFADCAVVPDPTAEQLADIAIASAHNYATLTGEMPRVAMLSFSTRGSGGSVPMVLKVQQATELALDRIEEYNDDMDIDGELQFDAAFVPSVAERKAKDSPVAGQANVFVFPDLNAGNIGYKIVERLAGAQAIGPIVQGLAKPYMDLSRGCSANDIVLTTVIAAILSA